MIDNAELLVALDLLEREIIGRIPGAFRRGSSLVLPPRHPEFGEKVVDMDNSIGLKLTYGRFAQAFFEFDATTQNRREETHKQVTRIASLLIEVVEDRMVFYRSICGIGGSYSRDAPSMVERVLPLRERWVWSGPLGSSR